MCSRTPCIFAAVEQISTVPLVEEQVQVPSLRVSAVSRVVVIVS